MAALGEEVEVGNEDQRSNISEKKGQMSLGTLGCGAQVIFARLCNILSGGGGFNSGGGGGGFNSGGGGGGLMPYRWWYL